MRPIHLSMTAFGPFADQEEINFESFGESPLFLINGPTGSGKTTILDAICFALYGKSTGNERDGAHLRSDGANLDTLTEVTFQFELSGSTYRIRRTPDQERPKARGEGTTRQSSEAQLYKLLAGGEEELLVPEKITEANRMIEELTGLNVDQFRQVMVLPQGKFRELLMADSNDREKIFGQLFQTHIYKRLEDRLKEQALGLVRKRQQLRDNYTGILMNVGVENDEALDAEARGLDPQVALALTEKESQIKLHTEATKALERARNLEASFLDLERNRNVQRELQEQKGHYQQQEQRLEANQQAQRIKPLYEELTRRQNELVQAETTRNAAQVHHLTIKTALQQAEQALEGVEGLTTRRDEVKATLARLEGYQARVEQLTAALTDLEQATVQLDAGKDANQNAQQMLSGISARIVDKDQEGERLQVEIAALGPMRLKLQETTGQLSERRELETLVDQQLKLQTELSAHNQTIRPFEVKLEVQMVSVQTMELAWHKGQAVILASQLHDDAPCPVCGSKDHPLPALSADPPPTQTELQEARHTYEEAGQLLAVKKEERLVCEASLKGNDKQQQSQRKKLKGLCDVPVAELLATCDGLKDEIIALEKAAENLDNLKTNILELKASEVVAQQALDISRKELITATSRHAGVLEQKKNAEQELPEAFRVPGALADAVTKSSSQIGTLETQISTVRGNHSQALQQSTQAEARLESAKESENQTAKRSNSSAEQWDEALAKSAFDSREHYKSALLESALSEEIKGETKGYQEQCQKVAGAIGQLENQLKKEARPVLEIVEKQLEEIRVTKLIAEEEWQSLDERLRQLLSTMKKLQSVKADLVELDEEYKVIGTLSDVVNGKNPSMISLQRFVLSVLLDDVLLVASERLKLMSKGRYQLLRKEDPTRRNRASGLDLQVEDSHYSTVRPVGTLSGGEGFMAALSLALGLSDVVQSYAGGIRLDTLFIDEGFGSLDPESLDLAIQTLVDLQSTGRMVGVISHVGELKEQMANRIDVHASRVGSSVSLVTA